METAGLIAEAARQGEADVSLVSVDSTTARAHHDAAGMLVGKDVMEALEEAAAEQERARQKGALRQNRTGGTAETTLNGKNADTSATGAGNVEAKAPDTASLRQ
jgi:hypothetical protein